MSCSHILTLDHLQCVYLTSFATVYIEHDSGRTRKKIYNKYSFTNVRTGIRWTSLFCVYFVMCGLIAQWPSEFNISIHRLIGNIFFVTQCIVKWAVIWWNLSSFEDLHFLIYPKCTFVRITAFSLLSMNNYTVLYDEVTS